jgi:hypothetical protein
MASSLCGLQGLFIAVVGVSGPTILDAAWSQRGAPFSKPRLHLGLGGDIIVSACGNVGCKPHVKGSNPHLHTRFALRLLACIGTASHISATLKYHTYMLYSIYV